MREDFWAGFEKRFNPSYDCSGAVAVDCKRRFSADECKMISQGYCFGVDEGKWIIIPRRRDIYFYVVPLVLCFVCRFEAVGEEWQMNEVEWLPANFMATDSQVAPIVNFLIDVLLLRRESNCPFPDDLPEEKRKLYRYMLVGNI